MSQRNVALGRSRVYDAASPREEVRGAGFEVLRAGGHTLKPFTDTDEVEVRVTRRLERQDRADLNAGIAGA